MLNQDGFSNVYDSMTGNYGELERIMESVYQYTQSNPSNEEAEELLVGLGKVAQKMIGTQKEFTIQYGDSSIKGSLMDNLDDKALSLASSLEETKEKNKNNRF